MSALSIKHVRLFLLIYIGLVSYLQAASSPQSVKLPSIDVSGLGSIGLVGQYDSISKYTYVGQQNASADPVVTDNLIMQSSSELSILNSTNGIVSSLCSLGSDSVFFAGNFTKIGSQSSFAGLASYNSTTGNFSAPTVSTASPNGSDVNTLYCDEDAQVVYLGGNFTYLNSTGVAVWSPGNSSWLTPLFGGFEKSSVINSIVAFNNNLIFGGQFTSLANSSLQEGLSNTTTNSTTKTNITITDYTQQTLSFGGASISAEGTDSSTNASAIACPSSGSNWKLTDNRQGTWTASWPMYFTPTKLRLYNLDDSTDGTKTFRFIAFPLNGIMNFTYTDPETGDKKTCDANCPLPQSSTKKYVDFEFIDAISMDSFQLYLLDYYGSAAGLSGVEIIQSDLNVYANNTLNTGLSCQTLQFESSASTSGSGWTSVTAGGSTYESNTITDSSSFSDISVTLKPAVPSKGNFSLHLFTPGCSDDDSCSARGQVNVTVYPKKDTAFSSLLFQTNDYEKYDSIYNGTVDPSDGFTPYITIQPVSGQNTPLTIVADRIQYIFSGAADLNSTNSTNSTSTSSVPLNGLFEYSLSNFTKYAANSSFSPVGNTTINLLGSSLDKGASVSGLAALDSNTLLVAGSFDAAQGSNAVLVSKSSVKSLSGNGTNGAVSELFSLNNGVVGLTGSFSSTKDGKTSLPSGFGIYNNSGSSGWASIGSGISGGSVDSATLFELNGTTSSIALSGNFTAVNGSAASGFGIYIPSEQKWLASSTYSDYDINGHISDSFSADNEYYYFGSLQVGGSEAPGAVFLNSDFDTTAMPFTLTNSNSSSSTGNGTISKRDSTVSSSANVENSIYCGAFANSSVSIIGGRFTGKDKKSGSSFENIAIVDQSGGSSRGLSDNVFAGGGNNTIYTLLVNNNKLFVGGEFTARISGDDTSGLFFYDLNADNFTSTQPPGLLGGSGLVTTLNMRPDTNQLVVMGSFEQAGSLGCESFCIYDLDSSRWNSPSGGLSGLVSSATFIGSNVIFFAGNLTLNSTSNVYFAQYDFEHSYYEGYESLSEGLPGPVNSFVLNGDGVESIFASGSDSSSNEVYVAHWNNSAWQRIDSPFESYSTVTGLTLLYSSSNHASSAVLPENELLLVTGNIGLKGFGNASSVLYDGNNWQPLFLTTSSTGNGAVNAIYSQKTQTFNSTSGKKHMKRGFVVLVSLAIAIGIMFLLILAGLLVAFFRRKRKGYMPAPRVSEGEMEETIPPSSLIKDLDRGI